MKTLLKLLLQVLAASSILLIACKSSILDKNNFKESVTEPIIESIEKKSDKLIDNAEQSLEKISELIDSSNKLLSETQPKIQESLKQINEILPEVKKLVDNLNKALEEITTQVKDEQDAVWPKIMPWLGLIIGILLGIIIIVKILKK